MVEIVLTNDLSELERLAEAVAAFGHRHRLPDAAVQQMALALDELVTNTITHGYGGPGDRSRPIVLRLEHTGDWLEAELIDEAPPFDPFTTPPPDLEAPLEEREVGGLGVHLVRTLVDRVAYVREGAHNHVRLGKRVAPGVGAS